MTAAKPRWSNKCGGRCWRIMKWLTRQSVTVVTKINSSAEYSKLFKQAFGKAPGMETIGMAIAAYERTLNSANSPFDRWYYGHDKTVLNDKAQTRLSTV